MGIQDNSQQPSIFGADAYSPAEIQEKVEKLGVKKANMPFLPSFMLSMVAGGSIGLGALYFCIVISDPALSFGLARMLGGVAFSLGLVLVLVAGAELFTGNNLIVMAWANGQITTGAVLRNWTTVYIGNAVGAFGLVFLVFMSHHADLNNGLVGLALMKTAVGKIAPSMITIFFKGILCNLLVCLAVWVAYAGRSVTDKIVALVLPVSAFVAAGFEHCIANMYFLPLAILLNATGHAPAGFDGSLLTVAGIFHNLIPATLGNIVGGSGFVGFVYWMIYRKGLGQKVPAAHGAEAAPVMVAATSAAMRD